MTENNWYYKSSWVCRNVQRDLVFEEALSAGNLILDIGSGGGRTAALLRKRGKTVIEVDIDIELLKRSKELSETKGVYICANAKYLPHKDIFFDAVVLEEVIEHIDKDTQKKVIQEVHRVLKRDGKLILSTPNKYIYRFFMYLNKINKLEFDRTWFKNPEPTHIAELTPSQLFGLLDTFHTVGIQGINPYLDNFSKNRPLLGIGLLAIAFK